MAKRKPRAPRARTHMLAIQRKRANGVTKEDLIAAIRKEHPEILRSEEDDIEYLGLMTIANSICNLKLGAAAGMQIEMFEEYGVSRAITLNIADATGHIQKVTKSLDRVTKGEARQFVADHDQPPTPKQSRTVQGVRRMLDDIGNTGEDDWTLKRCLKTARTHSEAM